MNDKTSINILLNGPSFNFEKIDNHDAINIVTNQFSTDKAFILIKPEIYILCDSFYWSEKVSSFYKERRMLAFEGMNKNTTWPMQVWIPDFITNREFILQNIHNNNIKLNFFNSSYNFLLPYGYLRRIGRLIEFLWSKNIIAPPPHNVLLHCLYVAKLIGLKKIDLYGADQDYFKGFAVGANNVLTRVTNYHNEKLHKKIYVDKSDLVPSNLGDELIKQGELFKLITRYGEMLQNNGFEIINRNTESMIDCFPKSKYE